MQDNRIDATRVASSQNGGLRLLASESDLSAAPLRPSLLRSPASANIAAEPALQKPNHLLRLLKVQAPDEYERLMSVLEPVTLERSEVLSEIGGPIPWVYFPEGAVGSLIKILSSGKRIEVGTAGIEGMVGLAAFLGASTIPILCVIQVPGNARRMRSSALREVAGAGTALHGILQCYAQYQFDQAAQSIACNGMHTIEHRCARWLLMTHDRVQADQFELTHEYLATMLGARRASVSEVAEEMKQAGIIRYHRGKLTIVDRPGLERIACECYEADRADYARLLSLDMSAHNGDNGASHHS